MNGLVRTTITVPKRLLHEVKIAAAAEETSISKIIREGLEIRLRGRKRARRMPKLGKYSLGIKDTLRRKDLYGKHLARKISS